MKIGNITTKNNVFLAPMAGVGDMPFRILCSEMDCGMVYSEMVSGKGILYDNENTKELLKVSSLEKPVAIQIFGSDPYILSEITKKISDYSMDVIDINMGCPAPKITKNGEGSALMKNPKLIGEIVKAVSKATTKPVTVKIRKGFDDATVNAVEVAKIIEDNGAVAVAVHGRTREQYYSGVADWDIIAEVKNAVTIPVIGNGDITTPQKAKEMIEYTKCDAIMIGRAAQGNPWIFKQVAHYLETGTLLHSPSIREKIETALRHGKMLVDYKGEFIGVREMRKHISWYTKGLKDSAELRLAINKAETFLEIEALLENWSDQIVVE